MYPVPTISGVVWSNDTKTYPSHRLLEVLQILDSEILKDSKIGLDVEGTGLNPFADYWDLTGIGFSVRTGDLTGQSFYVETRYPSRQISGPDLDYFKAWLKKNENRLVTFNNSYEYKAFKRTTGKDYEFQDSRAVAFSLNVNGSLKSIAQRFCGAHEWEGHNSEVVGVMGLMNRKVALAAPSLPDKMMSRRRQYEADGTPYPDTVDGMFDPEDLELLGELIDFESVVLHMKATKDAKKGGIPLTRTDVETGETRDWVLTPNQIHIAAMILKGLTREDVLMGLMYDNRSGWGAAPTRVLSPYCGWDCFYTLIVWDTFMTDERCRNSQFYFRDEINFAGVLESYSICWDDRVATELDTSYLALSNDHLAKLIPQCDWKAPFVDTRDKLECYGRLLNRLGGSTPHTEECVVVYPVVDSFDYPTGGPTSKMKTVEILSEEDLESRTTDLRKTIQLRVDSGRNPTKTQVKNLEGLIEYAKNRDDLLAEVRGAYTSTDEYVRDCCSVLVMSPDGKWGRAADWVNVPTLAGYNADYASTSHRVKWRARQDNPVVMKTAEVRIEDERGRLDVLKSLFNPGSNTDESRSKFWKTYLTPRVITANLFYGLKVALDSADVWKELAGRWVNSDEQKVDESGELLFDKDGEPVLVQVLEASTINVVENSSGRLLPIVDIHINMNDLQDTITRLTKLCDRIVTPDWKWVDTSPTRLDGIRAAGNAAGEGVGEKMVEHHLTRKSEIEKSIRLREAIRSSIASLATYLEQQTGGFVADIIELQHKVHTGFLCMVDNDFSTYTDEYWMIFHMRVFKKSTKNRSTYVIGKKLGQGAVEIANETAAIDSSGYIEPPLVGVTREESVGDLDKVFAASDEGRTLLLTNFNPCAADTRRWTSRNHTVPASSELRTCYVPRIPGFICDHSDYSGFELATVAAIAQETSMIEAIQNGEDLHMKTAMGVYNLPRDEISPMMRRYAKTCTFLSLYGGEAATLADQLQCSMAQAKEIIDGFFRTYPKLKAYIDETRKMAMENGWVPSIVGAPLNVDRDNPATVNTTSINYRIQSSATMLGGVSFYKMWKTMKELGIPFIPTSFTHDSLDSEQHPAYYFVCKKVMHYIAEKWVNEISGVPTRLDGESGNNVYALLETDIKSSFSAGTSSDPHMLHLEGEEKNLHQFVDKFRPYFDIEMEVKHKKTTKPEIEELWIARRAMNRSMLVGDPMEIFTADIRLVNKSGAFHPDIDSHPIYRKMIEAGY